MSDYTTCEEGVTRRQAFQPCDKPAVAMRLDPEDKKPYPVCRRHCRENMVPLAEVKAEAVIELVARIEAAVILLGDDDITPTGRRMISKVLNPYRQGEEQ